MTPMKVPAGKSLAEVARDLSVPFEALLVANGLRLPNEYSSDFIEARRMALGLPRGSATESLRRAITQDAINQFVLSKGGYVKNGGKIGPAELLSARGLGELVAFGENSVIMIPAPPAAPMNIPMGATTLPPIPAQQQAIQQQATITPAARAQSGWKRMVPAAAAIVALLGGAGAAWWWENKKNQPNDESED